LFAQASADIDSIRRKRRQPSGERYEFDAIAVTAELVFLNSTKPSLRSGDVHRFVDEIAEFRRLFPEYDALPLIGVLATLAVEDSVLAYASKQGFLVLAVGDEIMDRQNPPDFEPRRWATTHRPLASARRQQPQQRAQLADRISSLY
jgi:hypothetical protein